MVNESASFGLSLLGTVVGLVVMLYGVKLTSGLSISTPMIVGGVIVLAAIALHTAALMGLDSGHDVA